MSTNNIDLIDETTVRKTYIMISDDSCLSKEDINGVGHWTYRFPEEFLNSVRPKSIEVHHVKFSTTNGIGTNILPNDVVLHSDFIKRDAYLDHSVMLVNEVRTKYKKYAYLSKDQLYTIWFSTFLDSKNQKIPTTNTHFIIELMLIY